MWLYVATAQNPVVERIMTLDLHVRGLASNELVMQKPDREQVRLSGPRSAIATLTPDLVNASIDLSGLAPGEHRIPIEVATPPEVRVTDRNPAEALVVLDALIRRRLPVEVSLRGTPSQGVTLGVPRTTPVDVIVSGAATEVDEVRHATVTINVANLTQQLITSVPVRLVDATGQDVRNVTATPSIVEAYLPVREGVITKVVPVVPTIVGAPPPPLTVASVTVVPETAAVSGSEPALEPVQLVPTAPVDLGAVRADVERQVPLQMPAGVTSRTTRVTVIVRIGHEVLSTVLHGVPVRVIDVPARVVSRVMPDRAEVEVEGPPDVVTHLTPQGITLEADAAGRHSGSHQVDLRTILPPGVRLLTIRPSRVVVILTSS
jgi:YbbR domain-containing protein